MPSVTTLVTISHQDYRHLGSKAISEMGRRKAVIRLPVSEERSCNETLSTGSTRGKFDRKPYRPSRRRTTNALEKVQIDIKVPMVFSAIGGFKFFLILVDDGSGCITVFLIQARSQALQHYKTFCEQVRSQLDKRIAYLRCDNSEECATYLSTQATVLKQIPNYTPEMNGGAKRNIKTLMNIVCGLLKNTQVPKNLWVVDVPAAALIKNLYTCSNKSTPHEIWNGSKPDVSILKVYGCKVYNRCSCYGMHHPRIRSCLYLPIDDQENPQHHPYKKFQVRRDRT